MEMKDPHGNRITFAPQDKISLYEEEVIILMREVFGDDRQVWCSDMSSMNDFPIEQEDINTMSEKLGISIAMDDYVYEVAQRLHLHRVN